MRLTGPLAMTNANILRTDFMCDRQPANCKDQYCRLVIVSMVMCKDGNKM